MITNERQYAISQTQLQRFEKAAEAKRRESGEGVDPRLAEAMAESLEGQAETLREEVQRYEALREGRIGERQLGSLREIPTALIEGRIVAGLTQRQLGEQLGVKEQQVQRWEANLYSGVGVERIQEVADALDMEVRETVSYAVSSVST